MEWRCEDQRVMSGRDGEVPVEEVEVSWGRGGRDAVRLSETENRGVDRDDDVGEKGDEENKVLMRLAREVESDVRNWGIVGGNIVEEAGINDVGGNEVEDMEEGKEDIGEGVVESLLI